MWNDERIALNFTKYEITHYNFMTKMMTLIMAGSSLTFNGSAFFSRDDFEHLPGLETLITVGKI